MNSEEAKVLLHAYHLGGGDPDDPRVVKALAQTRRDPELLAWFHQQRAHDVAIGDKLQQVRPPAGLAEKIILGRKARIAPRRNRYVMPLALAASIVFLLSLALVVVQRSRPSPTEFAALQTDMAGFLVQFPKLDLPTEQWPDILRWLTSKPSLARAEIPSSLQKFPGLGCREVNWRGKTLMLICFAAQGEVVHLFVLPKADVPDAPFTTTTPVFAHIPGWNTASWAHGEIAYLVLTKGNEAFLQKLISGPHPG